MRTGQSSPQPSTRLWLWRAASAAWCGVIFWGSSIPGSQVPGRFGPFGHFGEYAILGALIFNSVGGSRRRRIAIALVLAAVYAASDEFHQSFVPMRTPDPIDWAVDMAGALSGTIATTAFARPLRKHRQ